MRIHIFNNSVKVRETMGKDVDKEYREEMQQVMLELKLKTDKFMKKLKDSKRMGNVDYGVIK